MIALKRINPRIPNVLVAVVVAAVISYFIDFNEDVVVDIADIRMAGLSNEILQYNNVVALAKAHGNKRAELGFLLDEMKKTRSRGDAPSVEIARLQSDIYIKSSQIALKKEQLKAARHSLRQLKFKVEEYGDKYTYYPFQEADKEENHQVWRLQVGLNQLDLTEITLTGGGAIVGSIPKGLPEIAVPELSFATFFKLLPIAIIVSMLGFMEAISIAKAMAAKTGQRIDPNQELIGQGLANILGSATSSYVVSGSFSRSAINLQAGAVTGMSSVVTSLVVVATLLFFTPLLYHLPQATLAAIIMVAVVGLLNIRGFIHAWKAQWYDGAIAVITFTATLAFAPHLDKGIMVGIVLSMGVFLYRAMRPTVVGLAMDEDRVLKSAEHYHLQGCRHIVVIRFDGPLFYANASYLDEKVIKFRVLHPDLRYILLDARGINDMDASGEEALSMVVDRVRAAGIGFAMAGVKGQVVAVMKRTHLLDKISQEEIYPNTKSAVAALVAKIHFNTDLPVGGCGDCPLINYLPVPRSR
jgi:MFS superfamily sulfate permease-like transporter